TPEGQSFLVDAKRVLELSEQIVESVRHFSRHEFAQLNIGYVANGFYDLLPVTLASFQRSFPTLPINLFDMTCGDQFHALQDSKIDVGLVGVREAIEHLRLPVRPLARSGRVGA